MRASKESCEQARHELSEIERLSERLCRANSGVNAEDWKKLRGSFENVRRFLNAAHKRLPTEASYAKDAKRRKAASKAKA